MARQVYLDGRMQDSALVKAVGKPVRGYACTVRPAGEASGVGVSLTEMEARCGCRGGWECGRGEYAGGKESDQQNETRPQERKAKQEMKKRKEKEERRSRNS